MSLAEWCGRSSASRDPRGGPRLPRERVLDREAEGGWALAEAVAASPRGQKSPVELPSLSRAHCPLRPPSNAGSTEPTGA